MRTKSIFTGFQSNKNSRRHGAKRDLRLEHLEPRELMSITTLPQISVLQYPVTTSPSAALIGQKSPLAAPTNLRAANVLAGSLDLSWKCLYRPDYFCVQMSTNGSNWESVATVAGGKSSCHITGLSPRQFYSFRVCAFNHDGKQLQTSSFSNTAQATTRASFLGLGDIALADLTYTLDRDGSINRSDMVQIIRSVGSDDGVVNATEMNDLRTIMINYGTLNMPEYVRVLSNDVINGNMANAHYQGQALGNLAAGSSNLQLTELVDKWFFGADHPNAESTSFYAYRSAAGSLFVNGPDYTDMRQGDVGDCYFISAMGALAHANPSAIASMFIDNGDNTWTVRFFAPDGRDDYVTVDRMLPATHGGYLIYQNELHQAGDPNNELWLELAEKAYAQWNETGKELLSFSQYRNGQNSYASIDGGWEETVDAQVLNHPATKYSFQCANMQAVLDAISANQAVTVSTFAEGNGLWANHAYVVIGYDSTQLTFQLDNPKGYDNPGPLTWDQLATNCNWFVVADPWVVPVLQMMPTSPSSAGGGLVSASMAGSLRALRQATPDNIYPQAGSATDVQQTTIVKTTPIRSLSSTAHIDAVLASCSAGRLPNAACRRSLFEISDAAGDDNPLGLNVKTKVLSRHTYKAHVDAVLSSYAVGSRALLFT